MSPQTKIYIELCTITPFITENISLTPMIRFYKNIYIFNNKWNDFILNVRL